MVSAADPSASSSAGSRMGSAYSGASSGQIALLKASGQRLITSAKQRHVMEVSQECNRIHHRSVSAGKVSSRACLVASFAAFGHFAT